MPRAQLALFTILYAAEGAPIGFIWWALPTLLRTAGVPIEQITALTAMVLLPWIFKFAWAPLVDALRGGRWGFRAWIITSQLVMGLTLAPLLWVDPSSGFNTWRTLLLMHAVAAATQDVAIDALAINSVALTQRGLLNGCMQAGMLTGRSLFGGGALLVAAWFGYDWIVALLIAWIWTALLAAVIVRVPEPAASPGMRDFGRALASVARSRTTWFGVAFALTSAAAFEAAGQLAGPYLVDRGVPTSTIGVFFGLVVVAAMLTGGLVGGRLSDRMGRLPSVGLFLGGFVAMILALAATDRAALGGPTSLLILLGGMYFFVGLFTAASYALFMDLTDPRLGGTQFSTYMAATNGCESWAVWTGGRIAGSAGYPAAFAVMSMASVLSLSLLPLLRSGHQPRSRR